MFLRDKDYKRPFLIDYRSYQENKLYTSLIQEQRYKYQHCKVYMTSSLMSRCSSLWGIINRWWTPSKRYNCLMSKSCKSLRQMKTRNDQPHKVNSSLILTSRCSSQQNKDCILQNPPS